jgi:NIMA (never in mitosis gene a)-related kinase
MNMCTWITCPSQFLSRRNRVLLSEEQVWHMFIQTCLGMFHIHDKHILHRDLKSMNLFLDANNCIKIGDLGVAKVMGSMKFAHTGVCMRTCLSRYGVYTCEHHPLSCLLLCIFVTHAVVGTPYYLSPELCEDQPYNEKSDVWALGCLLYEMCTLKPPFDAKNQGVCVHDCMAVMKTVCVCVCVSVSVHGHE